MLSLISTLLLRASACNASRVLAIVYASVCVSVSLCVCHTLQPYQNNAS